LPCLRQGDGQKVEVRVKEPGMVASTQLTRRRATGFVVLQVAVGVAFGLLAGRLRVRTGSIGGPVVLHATMNLLAVV